VRGSQNVLELKLQTILKTENGNGQCEKLVLETEQSDKVDPEQRP
jgi:hypothetical protein